eukprot:401768-Rhodomonas_salina.2
MRLWQGPSSPRPSPRLPPSSSSLIRVTSSRACAATCPRTSLSPSPPPRATASFRQHACLRTQHTRTAHTACPGLCCTSALKAPRNTASPLPETSSSATFCLPQTFRQRWWLHDATRRALGTGVHTTQSTVGHRTAAQASQKQQPRRTSASRKPARLRVMKCFTPDSCIPIPLNALLLPLFSAGTESFRCWCSW